MNNLLSFCGLVDAKIRASDKDLPVHEWTKSSSCELKLVWHIKQHAIFSELIVVGCPKKEKKIEMNRQEITCEFLEIKMSFWANTIIILIIQFNISSVVEF